MINNTALALALWAAVARARELLPYALLPQWFVPQTAVALMAGAFMVQHCANAITAGGVGNGSTLVICLGIVTEYADTAHAVLAALEAAALPPLRLAALLLGYLSLVLFTVYLSSAELRLPMVQYSTTPPQQPQQRGRGGAGGRQAELFARARALLDRRAQQAEPSATYFPVKLNSAGVMVRALRRRRRRETEVWGDVPLAAPRGGACCECTDHHFLAPNTPLFTRPPNLTFFLTFAFTHNSPPPPHANSR